MKKSDFVVFPFDLFGSAGAGAGARLLADELREILADNRRELVPTRAQCYSEHIRLRELHFDKLDDYTHWRRRGRQAVRQALRRDDFLFWIAGNHLGVLPVYDELAQSNDSILIVQLDAHLDIHNFRDCSTELSHGNFLRHCAGPLPPLLNVGHRDLLLLPDYIAQYYRRVFAADELAVDPRPALDYLRQAAAQAQRVFLDLDCDVFDPMAFSAVTEPVPFGLSAMQVLQVIDAVGPSSLAGVMFSEFDPTHDRDDRGLSLLVWLIEYLLLRRYEVLPYQPEA